MILAFIQDIFTYFIYLNNNDDHDLVLIETAIRVNMRERILVNIDSLLNIRIL